MGTRAVLYAAAIGVGLVAALWGGTPVIRGEGWDWFWLGGGAGMAFGGAFGGRQILKEGVAQVPKRHRIAVFAVAAFTLFAVVGSVTTPVIDGEPVLFFSQAARVQEFAEDTEARILRLAEIDQLFDLDQTAARLKVADLEDAYQEVGQWATHYSQLRTEDLPAESLAGVELLMEQATGAALRAIDQRLQWVKSSDPVARAGSDQWRATYIEAVLQAGQALDLAAREFGIIIAPTEGGAVE